MTTTIERKAGKKERIQKLLKNFANVQPELVKVDPSVIKQPHTTSRLLSIQAPAND